jgi:hypothetical protein
MEVAVRVQDPSGSVSKDVVLRAQDANTVRDLVEVLVDVMEWPRETVGGEPLAYRLRRPGDAEPLDEDIVVVSLGIAQGDVLVLGPERPA